MASHLETLASYVPSLIVQRFNAGITHVDEPTAESFPAIALFADISGFTALTERLAARGPSGAEDLTRYLNSCFGELIELITSAGGDTVKFAGDALLALWRADRADDLPAIALVVAEVALKIQTRLHHFSVGDGIHLSLKVALGAGSVAALQLGGVFHRWELLVAGGPLSQCGVANGQASPGDVVLSAEAWAQLGAHGKGEVREHGVVRLLALDAPGIRTLQARVKPNDDTADALRRFIPGAIRARLDARQSDWLAELRQVSVVFINLPDFTYDTPLDRAQEAMRAMQTALYRFEGSINKISVDDKGASLIAVLGLPPLAHEDDPERALRAAQTMQQGLTRLGFRSSVGVTSGLAFCGAVGSAVRREYTVMGDVVNLAARLMVAASGGILCDAPTAEAAGARVECTPLPAVKLKGKAEPVAIFRPGAKRAGTAADRMNARRLIGREVERAALAAVLESAGSSVVVVQADVGMGVISLLDELVRAAAAAGWQVLACAADAIDSNTPYHAWRALLEDELLGGEHAPAGEIPAALATALGGDPALCARIPLLDAVFAHGWPDNETTAKLTGRARAEALHALVEVGLAQRAKRSVLVMQDAQWMDSASWALLDSLRAARPGLAVVIGARRTEAPAVAEFIARSGARQLVLGSLGAGAMAQTLREHLDVDELPPAVLALVLERADGNPYFGEALVSAMLDRGQIELVERELRIAAGVGDPRDWQVPTTVEGMVTASIDRLPAPEQLTLKVASVLGRVFSQRALHRIYPMSVTEAALAEHLKHLDDREMTPLVGTAARSRETDDTQHRFRNSFIQDTAYNLMLFAQRRQLHRAVAEWFEQEYADDLTSWLPVLAYHWRKAGADRSPDEAALLKAIGYYEQAGNRAYAAYVNAEAMYFFQAALTLIAALPQDDALLRRELHLQLALGTAAVAARSYGAPEVQAAYARASELCRKVGEQAQLFRALRGLWQYRVGQGEMDEARRLGDELIALATLAGESALLIEANRLLGNNAYWTGDFSGARHSMEQAVTLFDPALHSGLVAQFGQDPDVANRGILAWALCFLGHPRAALAHLDAAVARADELGHPFSQVFAYGAAMWANHFLSEIDAAERWADATIAIAAERGFTYLQVAGQVVRAWAHTRRGDPNGLDELAGVLAGWRASGATIGMHLFLVVQANASLAAGHLADVEGILADPVLAHRSLGERWLEPELMRLRAEVAVVRDAWVEAEHGFRAALEVADEQQNRLARLRIGMSLVRLSDRVPALRLEARAMLEDAIASIGEGAGLGFHAEALACLAGAAAQAR